MLLALFGTLAVTLILTVPIGLCLGIASLATIVVVYPGTNMVDMLAQNMVTAMDSYALMAIPFFMLAGILMEKTGIADKLIDVAEALVGPVHGGLGMAAVLAAMFFAAISGSGPAVVAALGSIMIPTMKERGYAPEYSGALIAASSTIGPVIPPSIPMIIYGATVGVSVTKLFAAGLIPGILMGVSLMIYNYIVSKKRGYVGKERGGGGKWVLGVLKEGIWALLMPLIILGGIYAGLFTPTEAAVVGCLYGAIVGVVVYRQLTFKTFGEALIEAAIMSATVMIVMGGATTFGRILTMERVPEMIASGMLGLSNNKYVVMLLINLVLLVAGMFLDTISAVILLSPIFLPIILDLGFDPVHFGIIMTVNLCIGMLTPPLGVNVFVAQTISKVSFEDIVKNVLPMIAILIIALTLIVLIPQLTLFIPNLIGL